ncbi:MAG TPA: AzlC family ABC transporter permease, partial [Alphaproteobacteria bacterium]|nr:AzlC family ABC transporter permease [Alphaproteobacteria bacterium]
MPPATPPAPPAASPFRSQFLLGARLFLPLAISIAAYGIVWGVLAGQAGLSVAEVALMSGLVFAGASQFVALDLWTPGQLPVLSIVLAAGIVNLRMLLQQLHPLWRKGIADQYLIHVDTTSIAVK